MKVARKKKKIIVAIVPLFLLFFIVALSLFVFSPETLSRIPFYSSPVSSANQTDADQVDEIALIRKSKDLKLQTTLYKHLIERTGPEKAQEALYKSGLPFDGQTHLLNHTVGDWLYQKYGTDGLAHCKDYFLSSCYHGFVIKAVSEKGIPVLEQVMQKCWDNGYHVAVQCGHAIGHGFLAYRGYANLLEALADCETMKQSSENFPSYNCYDGIFMENIWAVHEDGKPSPDRWVNPKDPIYPCDDPQIAGNHEYVKACWSNQPMWDLQLMRGDIAKVGNICLDITDPEHQDTCFNAIARQIHTYTNGNTYQGFRMCALMPTEQWDDKCVLSLVNSFFGIGDRIVPFRICEALPESKQPACYDELVKDIGYLENKTEKEALCQKLPASWHTKCIPPS